MTSQKYKCVADPSTGTLGSESSSSRSGSCSVEKKLTDTDDHIAYKNGYIHDNILYMVT